MPFRTRLKVKRAKLPFATLNSFNKEAIEEFTRLRTVALQVIERDIMNAVPDQEEMELLGNAEPLQKSIDPPHVAQRKQAVRDFKRRLEFGAPIKAMMSERLANLQVLDLPADGGFVKFHRGGGLSSQSAGEGRERIVALQDIVSVPQMSTLGFRDALTGRKASTPKVLKHPKSEEYTLIDGVEEYMAARFVGVPAMVMRVFAPAKADPVPITEEGNVDRQEIEIRGRKRNQEFAYKLPSLLEPLAALARKYDNLTFSLLWSKTITPEEQEAMERAEAADHKVSALWVRIFNEGRTSGQSAESAAAAVRRDTRFIRAEASSERAILAKNKILERWEARREEWRDAWSQVLVFAKEDGLDKFDPHTLDSFSIHREARKGVALNEPDRDRGYPGGVYEIDDDVETLSPTGVWIRGKIIGIDGFDVRVRRADGSARLVQDPSRIRHVEKISFGGNRNVDKDCEICYNYDMKEQIRIPEMGVLIPAGSTSLRLENELDPITAELNDTPLQVNKETWERSLDAIVREVDSLTEQSRQISGNPKFRPNAPADGIAEFFEKRSLPVQRMNAKSGKPALDKETLQVFATLGDDLAPVVLAAREAISRQSQLKKWKEFADAGQVQANWNQLGTPHGRYSADTPNLQNRITQIRETVEPLSGFSFLSLDLGQAEYVSWASLSQDPTLIGAFGEGKDFHREMAEQIAKVARVEFDDMRKAGKTINFALLYLMNAWSLSKRLGVEQDVAQAIIDAYEERAPIAVAYKQRVIAELQKTGIATTKFGRLRELPEIKTAQRGKLHELTKTLWHHHNAGTAAEVLKIYQVRSWKAIRRILGPEDARIALQMHDEVVFQVRDEHLEEAREHAQTAFHTTIPGMLPFKVDVRTGKNWLEISK